MTLLLAILLAVGLVLCARSAFLLSSPVCKSFRLGMEYGLLGIIFAGVGSLGMVIHALIGVLR